MKFPQFRDVYIRNELPKSGPLEYESAIVNLDDKDGPGTHWVVYRKINNQVIYFDSFGNLQPPLDLIEYLGAGSIVKYNHEKYQDYDTVVCGHLCLKFLSDELYKINSPFVGASVEYQVLKWVILLH